MIHIKKRYYTKGEYQHLTKEEVKTFLDSIESIRDKAIFTLMYFHGLRVSEVRNLKIEDINLKDNLIYITGLKKGKKGNEYLNPITKTALTCYLIIRSNYPFSEVFASRKATRISRVQIYRLYVKYAKQIGLSPAKCHPHALRHSLAVHLSRGGRTAEEVQAILRHQKINSTMVYYQIMEDQRIEIQKESFKSL